MRPNVRAKLAPTVGRQAPATENVHRTCGWGLVAPPLGLGLSEGLGLTGASAKL